MISDLYFLDFYLSNEGEIDTTLEFAILRWSQNEQRAYVYAHSFINPKVLSRVRWSNALEIGIKKSQFEQNNYPFLEEILELDLLKDKFVICLNPSAEPAKAFLQNATSSIGLLNHWCQIFSENEEALKCTKPSQMLEFIGLPVNNDTQTFYTPLMVRLFSFIAIWQYLEENKSNKRKINKLKQSITISPVWPLEQVDFSLFEQQYSSLEQIEPALLSKVLSNNVADYVDWYYLSKFDHSWLINKKRSFNFNNLEGKERMAEFIFNKLFDFKLQLLVLIYYALYEEKSSLALKLAKMHNQFFDLDRSEREDFALFLVGNLGEFLKGNEKRALLRSIIHHTINTDKKETFFDYNFEELYKYQKDKYTFNSICLKNTSKKIFKEICLDNRVIYRYYELSGNSEQIALCDMQINDLFKRFYNEISDPFSSYWVNSQVKEWVEHITGYSWDIIVADANSYDNELVTNIKEFIANTINDSKKKLVQQFKEQLTKIILDIRQVIASKRDYYEYTFCFRGISIKIVYKRTKDSFIKRLLSTH